MEVDFCQEQRWWDAKASREETDLADERVNRLLRWRVIERHLQGVKTILDVGGGTGIFSISLAQKGFEVTHLDFSPKMIEIAKANARGVANLEFRLANATELNMFTDASFDLVLNMDGAISFCGSAAEKAISETCRVTKRAVIVSVSNRAWMAPVWLTESIDRTATITPAVSEMLRNGFWHWDQFPENAQLVEGYFGTLKAFLPDELRMLLEKNGMVAVELHAVGSLANLSAKALEKLSKDEALFNQFLDLCEEYDRICPTGPGTRQRAGLLAVARRTA